MNTRKHPSRLDLKLQEALERRGLLLPQIQTGAKNCRRRAARVMQKLKGESLNVLRDLRFGQGEE